MHKKIRWWIKFQYGHMVSFDQILAIGQNVPSFYVATGRKQISEGF